MTPRVRKHKRSLELISIPEPCEEPWDEMTLVGDGRRHCDVCMQDVYDLSSMTREAAEELVLESSGRLCVGFYRRRDGTVVTNDCTPVRHRALRRAAGRAVNIGARVASAGLAALAALGMVRASGWLRTTTAAHAAVTKILHLDNIYIDGNAATDPTWPRPHIEDDWEFLGGLMVGPPPGE